MAGSISTTSHRTLFESFFPIEKGTKYCCTTSTSPPFVNQAIQYGFGCGSTSKLSFVTISLETRFSQLPPSTITFQSLPCEEHLVLIILFLCNRFLMFLELTWNVLPLNLDDHGLHMWLPLLWIPATFHHLEVPSLPHYHCSPLHLHWLVNCWPVFGNQKICNPLFLIYNILFCILLAAMSCYYFQEHDFSLLHALGLGCELGSEYLI